MDLVCKPGFTRKWQRYVLRNTDVATRGGKRACNSNTGVIDGIVPSVAKNNVSS